MCELRSEARAAVRRQLNRWKNTQDTIDALEKVREQKEEELASCYSAEVLESRFDVRPAPLTGTPGTGRPGDPTGRAAFATARKIRHLEGELNRLQERLLELQHYIAMVEDAVNSLPTLECRVIRLRYIEFGGRLKGFWPELAAVIPVSVDYAKELEGKAVDRLAGILEGL